LVDVRDKDGFWRVLWLKRLLAMPSGAFPRVLAEELIGTQEGNYKGLDCLKGLEGGLRIKVRGFYKGAVQAWSSLSPSYVPRNGPVDDYDTGT
jgi:hypothetical protein